MKIENPIDFERLVAEADEHPFSGWDFRWIAARWRTDVTPWDYNGRVRKATSNASSLLDMGTGGGEKLARLAPFPVHTAATEAYKPNIPIAVARLEPMGINVIPVDDHNALPFDDCQFDLIINRHEEFVASEVARILRPGGHFITQQVGDRNNEELTEWLGGESLKFDMTFSLTRSRLSEEGLEIINHREAFPRTTFFDIGAVVYYLNAVPWQVLGFTVDAYRDRLAAIHNQIQLHGSFITTSHRWIIETVKPQI